MKRLVLPLAGTALIAGIAAIVLLRSEQSYQWDLPEPIPIPVVPADNPMTRVKVELGRWLFYDLRLSVNGTMSCGNCHFQRVAFTDARGRAIGATGELHPRGSMSLVNTAYSSRLTWANHLLDRLEVQALTPMFGENPVEMGMAGREKDIVSLIRVDPRYQELFPKAFPSDEDPFSVLNVVRAIASFVRSIVSFDSPYDHYLRGDKAAMTDSQVRGLELFFSERTECFHCHGGFNFTDSSTHSATTIESVGFHNNGLYNIGADGGYPEGNTGLHDLTGRPRDMGRFKAPTLRNIAMTAPYMHDGSIGSLEEVLDHYQQGGRLIADGPHAGDGSRNPYKSVFVRQFELSDSEREDLLAFLRALTDESVLMNPAFSNPFSDAN
jgi:cytochrome c peroxidase